MAAVVSFVVSLVSGLVSKTTIMALLKRAAVALGISAVTYTGVSITMASVIAHVNSNLQGAPSSIVLMLTLAKIPQALNVIFSAYAGAAALKGLSAVGAVTKYGISSTPGTVFSPGTF